MDKDTVKRGKVIVIEGSDGSGKATQTKKLFDRLAEDGFSIRKVEYPNYGSDSSALVKMYLGGEFGSRPDDVNPYAASSFYAVDRYASYKKEWEDFYFAGGIVLADRYTTANMVHQATKIDDPALRESFLDWLWDYEFVKLGLPVPDCVIFLDVDPSCSRRLMENRSNKINGEQDKDIHEKDPVFLQKSHASSCLVAEKYGWIRVSCLDSGELREIDDIHEEIYSRVINTI
ncbi:MAG TPA: thymidylate kinase [Clostridiaceae bacterium]|nr:thymidylate kinase [Clostridiaceae bacterium]